MSSPGWIKIHRALINHWCANEPEALAVWVRLLCEANFEDKKSLINGCLVDVKRGQLVFGLDAFSKKSGVSVMKLRRIISMLESDGMINRQKTSKYSLISIVCYDKYQDDDRQTAGKEQAKNNQITTPKEVKKLRTEEVKEVDKKGSQPLDFSSWPSMPSDQLLADWKALRKRHKADITQTVITGVGKQLREAAKNGFTVEQCFEEWICRGWRGFKAEWMSGSARPVVDRMQNKLPYGQHVARTLDAVSNMEWDYDV